MKLFLPERGREEFLSWIARAEIVVSCQITYAEVYRALMLGGLRDHEAAADQWERDWEAIAIVAVDDQLIRRAAALSVRVQLRTLDALHLASAESVQDADLRLATWDLRLARAARLLGIGVLPDPEP